MNPQEPSRQALEAFFKDAMNARKQSDLAHVQKLERRRKSKDARAARRRARDRG